MTKEQLAVKAKEAMMLAYSPYSGYKVGAALLCEDGSVYTGCNVENASYGATLCAERVALTKAISEGNRDFSAIAIVGSGDDYCYPCGMCRQVMAEHCTAEFKIILPLDGKETKITTLGKLLPYSFTKESMK